MANAKDEPTEIPLRSVTEVPVKFLALDHRNPRLFPSGELSNEVAIITQL